MNFSGILACTIASLYSLELVEDDEFQTVIDDITSVILEEIIKDSKVVESQAIKLFYSSDVFMNLSDKDTLLWKKPWQEIYEMIKGNL